MPQKGALYRYLRTPQGYLSFGDSHTKNIDAISDACPKKSAEIDFEKIIDYIIQLQCNRHSSESAQCYPTATWDCIFTIIYTPGKLQLAADAAIYHLPVHEPQDVEENIVDDMKERFNPLFSGSKEEKSEAYFIMSWDGINFIRGRDCARPPMRTP